MKQFAIAINSKKEYNRVKEYAEKWGYEFWSESNGFKDGHKFVFIDLECTPKTFNPCHTVDDCYTPKNWRKAIRKHSPLKLENICVRIDTVERVKEVWDIVRDSGVEVNSFSKMQLKKLKSCSRDKYLMYNFGELTRCMSAHVKNKTEITPKQLAQILGVKREKPIVHESVITEVQKINSKVVSLQKENANLRSWVEDLDREFNKRIDRLAKNYKILENTDEYSTRKELKAVNNNLRKRLYELEQKVSKQEVEYKELPLLKTDCAIPKIAICVENEQEFNDLMKIYEVLGWKWRTGDNPNKYFAPMYRGLVYPFQITFKNSFHNTEDDESYTVIPFSQIKNLV